MDNMKCSQCEAETADGDTEVPLPVEGECQVCGYPVCSWHGKEYHSRKLNGFSHHSCYSEI